MKKTKEQKGIIKAILKKARKESGRTVIEVVIWSECGEGQDAEIRINDNERV